MTLADIDRIDIRWEVEQTPLLIMMLARSGALNRRGEGSEDPATFLMAMGTTEDPIFLDLISQLPEEWLAHTGRYQLPDPQGKSVDLTITLTDGKGQETGFQFLYGSDSEGPPEDMIEFVELAMELTDPWYEEATRKQRKK